MRTHPTAAFIIGAAMLLSACTGTSTGTDTGGPDATASTSTASDASQLTPPSPAAPANTAAATLPTPPESPAPTSGSSASSAASEASPVWESDVNAGATTRGPIPELPGLDQMNPNAVAATTVATMQTFDAAKDTTDADPASRAAYLLTPEYAAQVTTPPLDGQNANWQVWSIQQAWSSVATFPAAIAWLPADTKVSATRGIGYIRTIHTDTGEEAQPAEIIVVTMTRAGDTGPWRVNHIEKA